MEMNRNRQKRSVSYFTEEDRKRQKREGIIILASIFVIGLLTYIENKVVYFGADFPVSNTILMFILININLLLLILIIFLVFRNLVKLLYDRKRKVMGAKLRTRLVMAFVMLTLLPTTVLFFFSISFITTSIKFWVDVNVEYALDASLDVGHQIYEQAEKEHTFFIKDISGAINDRDLLVPEKRDALISYIGTMQSNYSLDAVEVYDGNFQQITLARSQTMKALPFRSLSANHLQKDPSPGKIHAVFQEIASSEIVRSICTIPYGVERIKAKGFVVITGLISPNMKQNLEVISRGVEGHRQMKMIRRPIQITYYIALSIVALLVMFGAVWVGFYLAKTITIPIKELAEATLRVAEGDLNVSIDLVAEDEMGSLVDSFNKMITDLRESREQLERSARMLQFQNMEIEERRQFMEIVLKHVSAGVVTFDAGGVITTMSQSAEKMLHIQAESVLNKSFEDLLKGEHLQFALEVKDKLSRTSNEYIDVPVRVTIAQRHRSFLLHVNALYDEGGNALGFVLVFDDLTEIEKAQRLAAWREVARRIAHEVKNPLTPITLSAQRLKRKYAEKIDEPVFSECVQMIIDHVSMIRNLVNEFSTYAKFPSANPKPNKLAPIIEEAIALFREGHEEVRFEVHLPENIPLLNLDPQQIKQAMINLLGNAVSAIKEKGLIQVLLAHDPILKMVRIEVTDDGPGISDEDKIRLFEPYFSTKQAGMGLGLTIVNSIVADHFGMVRVQDNHPHGAKFVIELPVYGESMDG